MRSITPYIRLASLVALVAVLTGALLLAPWRRAPRRGLVRQAQTTATPIAFRYVPPEEFTASGYLAGGTTFWASNQTDQELLIILRAIEVKRGMYWVTQTQSREMLHFTTMRNPTAPLQLQPHQAGYATVKLPPLPSPGSWRAKVAVAQKLTGVADAARRVDQFPRELDLRVRGATNRSPRDVFAKSSSFYADPVEVFSQEVAEE